MPFLIIQQHTKLCNNITFTALQFSTIQAPNIRTKSAAAVPNNPILNLKPKNTSSPKIISTGGIVHAVMLTKEFGRIDWEISENVASWNFVYLPASRTKPWANISIPKISLNTE